MATKVDPQTQAILDQLRGGAGTAVDPSTQAILNDLRGQADRLKPAPVRVEMPRTTAAPPSRPRNPNVQMGPHGRVLDPESGMEMGLGKPVENAVQPLDTTGLEHGLEVAKDYAFKPLTFWVDPFTAVLNVTAEGAMKGERDPKLGPVLGSLAGAGKAAVTQGPAAAFKGLVGPPVAARFLNPPGYNAPGRPGGVDLPISPQVDSRARHAGNFLLQMFGSDAAAAKMFGGVVAMAAPEVRASIQSTGLLDKPIPGVGKSVNVLEGEAKLRNVVKQSFVKGDAAAGQIRREGDQVIKKVEGIYNGYRQRGVDFAKVTADGRRVNQADELVTHWIEAGRPGSTYGTRAAVEAEARKIGLDPADLRTIAGEVSRVYRKTGQWLEQVGFLKPGTVAHYGDQYAARLYHYASHNPTDIEAAIEAGRATGTISPEAEYLAMKVTKNARRGAGYSAAKGRKVTDPVVGEMLGREHQAGVTLGAALPKQAARGARFQALQEITQNPELFSATQKPGWVERGYGNVKGWFHPVADDLIQGAANAGKETPAQRLLSGYAGKIKSFWAGYNVPVQVGNIKQNIALSEGAAASRGIHWNPITDLIPDTQAFAKAVANPGSDPFYEGLAQRSRAFTGESGQLRQAGSSLRNNLGIDTTAQKIGKVVRKVVEAPQHGFGKAEELFKYSLYKKLVKGGIPEDEAARITDKALFDHTDVDARVAALNKYGFMPFLSTRLKGLENSASIFFKNPDILLRHSGFRLGQTAMGMAGPEAAARDQLPNTSGKLRIPIPGMRDEQGRQRYATGQVFSQKPWDALNPAMSNPFSGGVFAPIYNALQNQDPFKQEMTGEGSIVKPGELPPLDAAGQRLKYAVQGSVPPLTPFLGRDWERIQRARNGETRYGGPLGQPESVTETFIGALTGTRLVTPLTPQEKLDQGNLNTMARMPNQDFLATYQTQLQGGEAVPQDYSQWDKLVPTDQRGIAEWYKNAAMKLNNYVTGGEGKVGDPKAQATIKRLADWLFYLEGKLTASGGEQDYLQAAIDQAMQGQQ